MELDTNRSQGMATAALVLGILSILFSCCGGSIFLGALGIMLALLSRGALSMDAKAKVGLGLSIAGLVVSIFITLFFLISFLLSSEAGLFWDAMEYGYEHYDSPEEFEEYLYDYYYDYYYDDGYDDYNNYDNNDGTEPYDLPSDDDMI